MYIGNQFGGYQQNLNIIQNPSHINHEEEEKEREKELEATVGVEFTYIDVDDVDPNDPSKVLSIQIWDTCNLN